MAQLDDFKGLNISSFDSTSPLLKAFKDDKANYFLPDGRSYLALRLPSVRDPSLSRRLSSGDLDAETVERREQEAKERAARANASAANAENDAHCHGHGVASTERRWPAVVGAQP